MIKEFDNLISMCDMVNTTNSKLDKADILAKYPQCQELIEIAMNPYKKYHVTSKNIEKLKDKVDGTWSTKANYTGFLKILGTLIDGTLSGHNGIYTINEFIKEAGEEYREIVYNILDKNLKIRMGDKEINKVYPNLVPTFEVCLANKADDKKMAKVNSNWSIQRKLDGCRCICRREGDNITFYSRKGIEFETLQKVADSIRQFISDQFIKFDFVIDGEICIVNKNGDEIFNSIKDENGNELEKGIMSFIKKKNFTIPNPKYKMFDLLELEEFDSMKSNNTYTYRHNELKECFSGMEFTDVVENVPFTEDNFWEMQERVTNEGWEGLMLREDVGYEGKRTNSLLKVKKFFDDEYTVEGIEEGDFRMISKETGLEETIKTMTSVIITHKDNKVNVGSGFSIPERQKFFNDPSLILGKVITVQYFEETMNKKGELSLRFPTLKVIHGLERDT